jgi:hypothetical protein
MTVSPIASAMGAGLRLDSRADGRRRDQGDDRHHYGRRDDRGKSVRVPGDERRGCGCDR